MFVVEMDNCYPFIIAPWEFFRMKHSWYNGERVTKVHTYNNSLIRGGMNIRVRESLMSCVAFHFLCASCFHHIRSLTGIRETEKSRVQELGASVVVTRHVNAGVYNDAVCICCASLVVALGLSRNEERISRHRENREKFRRNVNGASNNVFFQILYFLPSLYESIASLSYHN